MPKLRACPDCGGEGIVIGPCVASRPASQCYADCPGCFREDVCRTCDGTGEVESEDDDV